MAVMENEASATPAAEGAPVKITITIDGEDYVVELPEKTFQDLLAIANKNGISFAAALEQAITNEKFLEDQQAEAGDTKLLIQKNGKLHELVREPA